MGVGGRPFFTKAYIIHNPRYDLKKMKQITFIALTHARTHKKWKTGFFIDLLTHSASCMKKIFGEKFIAALVFKAEKDMLSPFFWIEFFFTIFIPKMDIVILT